MSKLRSISNSNSNSNNNNPLEQLVASTLQTNGNTAKSDDSTGATKNDTTTSARRRHPYCILIQHSLSLSSRVEMARSLSSDEISIYKHAKVRLPSENARRNFIGGDEWIHVLLDLYLSKESHRTALGGGGGRRRRRPNEEEVDFDEDDFQVLWIETIAGSCRRRTRDGAVVTDDRLRILSLIPMDWDHDDNDEKDDMEPSSETLETASSLSLGNLKQIREWILLQTSSSSSSSSSSIAPKVIFLDSLMPFIVRHGFAHFMDWLEALLMDITAASSSLTDVVPVVLVLNVLTECLTPHQHERLEDVANALLHAKDDGEATLIRQGVRERGNVIRELVPFELRNNINNNSSESTRKLVLLRSNVGLGMLSKDSQPSSKDTKKENEAYTTSAGSAASTHPRPNTTTKTRPGRVILQHEEEEAAKRKEAKDVDNLQPKRPFIYVEDDDPDFDDMDEEDPDDDLDI